MAGTPPTALLFALRNKLEHNPATVYKAVYIGEVIGAVESTGWKVECFDVDVGDVSLTTIIGAFTRKPKVIFIWSEVHQARLAMQIARLAKRVDPSIQIFIYGRATVFIPQYFERYPFDAVHVSGDREAAIIDYLYALNERGQASIPGVSLYDKGKGEFVRASGRRLSPEEWPFPQLNKLPLTAYRDFSARYHGANYSPRLAITVSKGCELSCAYCGAHREEGNVDRRRSVDSIMEWIDQTESTRDGEIIHLFASNLFEDSHWIKTFCNKYNEKGHRFKWRGVTTIKSILDSELLDVAGANGCAEIAVGVETFSIKRNRTAKSTYDEYETVVRSAKKANVKLKGLVMLGYPGQTEDDIVALEGLARDWQIPLRYTGYTPLNTLTRKPVSKLDAMDIEAYDRRTFFDEQRSHISRIFFYKRITENGGYFLPN